MKKLTNEQFIEKARKIHGDKYDYSKVNYINNSTKVCIICPEHGEFWQNPNNHLNGNGCPICVNRYHYKTNDIIYKFKQIHGDKYDYSKVEYVDMHTKVCIICPEHGEFWQTPANHLHWKQNCPMCMGSIKKTTEQFINESKLVHDNKYDYSKVNYVNNKTKVCIICPTHGEFKQIPRHHLNGCGCPKCIESKLEKKVNKVLNNVGINKIFQYKNDWLINNKTRYPLTFDFYLPDYNIAIECQGEQHFKPVEHFGGDKRYKEVLQRDLEKSMICKKQNIQILYILERKFSKLLYENIKKEIYNTTNVIFDDEILMLLRKIKLLKIV